MTSRTVLQIKHHRTLDAALLPCSVVQQFGRPTSHQQTQYATPGVAKCRQGTNKLAKARNHQTGEVSDAYSMLMRLPNPSSPLKLLKSWAFCWDSSSHNLFKIAIKIYVWRITNDMVQTRMWKNALMNCTAIPGRSKPSSGIQMREVVAQEYSKIMFLKRCYKTAVLPTAHCITTAQHSTAQQMISYYSTVQRDTAQHDPSQHIASLTAQHKRNSN
jgi:hypothetical protein